MSVTGAMRRVCGASTFIFPFASPTVAPTMRGYLADNGEELPGSPCTCIAFDDGLAGLVDENVEIGSERLRYG